VACWNPEHKDADPSMRVHVETGVFHCFGCGYKGHILNIAKARLGKAYYEVHRHSTAQIKQDRTESQIFEQLKQSLDRGVVTKELPEVRIPNHTLLKTHPYLEGRGFIEKDFIKWEIGIISDDETYSKWIYIPVYFKNTLRTWFIRSAHSAKKLYGYYTDDNNKPVGYPRSDILYGLDSIKDKTKPLYIVEGILDKIWFDRAGRQVVACLGNRILKDQLPALKEFSHIIIVPDNDIAKNEEGLALVESALGLLAYCKVSVCILPLHRNDSNECTIEELLESTYKEQNILEFIKSERYIRWFSRKSVRRY